MNITREVLMKFRMFAVVVVLLACTSIGKAEITYWDCAPDTDGVLTLKSAVEWNDWGSGEYGMTMSAKHNSLDTLLDYGHMVGEFVSNGDPNIKMTSSIENDTGWTWTDYHINLYTDSPFSIIAGSALVNDPLDWNPNSLITPVNTIPGDYVDVHGVHHLYEGRIDYYAGTPVPNGGTLEVVYKINYATGTVNFTQEMVPTPEPTSLIMLACGLLGLLGIRRRFV
jgi:hypothetical protein